MLLRIALAAGCLLAGANVEVRANSYASSLTNNAGTVSFRLNDAADSVKVIGNGGALTIDLGALPRGLTVTNLASQGLTDGVFSVKVVKVGTGAPSLIGGSVAFNSPRGVAANSNPKSANFGWVYVANSAAGSKGDGLFAFSSDLADILGQGTTARTGGITNFTTGAAASPYRLKVGRDDNNIYVPDWSDASGNLYVVDPNLTDSPNTSYVLKRGVVVAPNTNPAVLPVGADNNHGSVAAVEVTGTVAGGDLKVYTIDEDYQTDPTSPSANEMNSLWFYDIGANPLPYGNPPTAKLGNAPINFVSQTMDLSYSPGSGYFYYSDLRSSGGEAGVIAVDKDGNVLFNSRTESVNLGGSADFLLNLQGVTASPDGKWLATLNNNNVVTIVPMVDGIPNLAGRFQYTGFGTTASGRGIAFDAANNLYVVSSGIGVLQSLSLGFTATNVTSSDGTFTQTTPSTEVSGTLLVDSTPADSAVLSEAATTQTATFHITRMKDDLAGPLSVNVTFGGTATRGTASTGDYSVRTNGVVVTNSTVFVIPTGLDSLDLEIVANDDNISELGETITLTVAGGAYNAVVPLTGTVSIVDNDATMVDISAVTFNTAYEGNTNDFIRYTLQRRGDTNATDFSVSINYAGTATKDVDYTSVGSVTIPQGSVTTTFDVFVLNDTLLEGNETVIASVASGAGYLVGTNNVLTAAATGTIIDDEEPAETILFSDDFNTDTSANWTVLFASVDPSSQDYQANFATDYSTYGIPPAPHSNGDSTGLVLTVNKGGLVQAAGLNAYPTGKTFSGNYALRFDMYLMQNGSAGTTEYADFGINHSGTKTNWFRNSGTGVPTGWTYDGLWFYAVADASDLGADLAAADFGLLTSPAVPAALGGPTQLATRLSSQFAQTFHSPPWTAGGGAGSPGNSVSSTTPSWAQVEISQIGNIVQWRINGTVMMTYTNKTAYTNGNIMLGYDDGYDSVGTGGGGLVIYDNVRVVKLPDNIQISSITPLGTNKVQIDFTGFINEPVSSFKLVTPAAAPTNSVQNVAGPYLSDTNASTAYSVVTPGTKYRVTTMATNAAGFFEIRRP